MHKALSPRSLLKGSRTYDATNTVGMAEQTSREPRVAKRRLGLGPNMMALEWISPASSPTATPPTQTSKNSSLKQKRKPRKRFPRHPPPLILPPIRLSTAHFRPWCWSPSFSLHPFQQTRTDAKTSFTYILTFTLAVTRILSYRYTPNTNIQKLVFEAEEKTKKAFSSSSSSADSTSNSSLHRTLSSNNSNNPSPPTTVVVPGMGIMLGQYPSDGRGIDIEAQTDPRISNGSRGTAGLGGGEGISGGPPPYMPSPTSRSGLDTAAAAAAVVGGRGSEGESGGEGGVAGTGGGEGSTIPGYGKDQEFPGLEG
ncbi:uncharacterized protein PAC_11002 [Phialocephala subalpina]|uniref:Uncharacterized protein n=1 Tax=Phialocephala subalpina TaxID=576137 RepID=A0A1L7X7X0_9HELO|nr:uncharacterized protein PAC_11002 [Phialocephala subalpina]